LRGAQPQDFLHLKQLAPGLDRLGSAMPRVRLACLYMLCDFDGELLLGGGLRLTTAQWDQTHAAPFSTPPALALYARSQPKSRPDRQERQR
jgi:hypothetical protein